jgi:ubiquinol-cytochrome c reductase cytochrome c subunit
MRVIAALALLLASSLLTAAATLEAQQNPGAAPTTDTPAAPAAQTAPKGDVENGKKIYTTYGCYQCHGYAAHGGPGPRLAPRPMAFAAFARYTRRPTGQMPPYTAKVVSDQEVADIYAFLLTIPPPPAVDTIPILAR